MNVIIVPIYKRIPLAVKCLTRLIEQGKRLNFDMLIVGTNEDLEQLPNNCIKVIHDNPVADKLNFALSKCKEYSKVMIWGSDNLANDKAIERLFKSRAKVVGYDSIYFHSIKTKKWSKYTSNGMTIGVGRTYSKSLLEQLDYRLYDEGLERGLDTNARKKYDKETILKLGDDWVLDVKFEQNITSHAIVDLGEECEAIEGLDFSDLIPSEREQVKFKQQPKKQQPKKTKIKVIEPFAGLEVGTTKHVLPYIAKELLKRNLIEIV